jgi:hypothetical protein
VPERFWSFIDVMGSSMMVVKTGLFLSTVSVFSVSTVALGVFSESFGSSAFAVIEAKSAAMSMICLQFIGFKNKIIGFSDKITKTPSKSQIFKKKVLTLHRKFLNS